MRWPAQPLRRQQSVQQAFVSWSCWLCCLALPEGFGPQRLARQLVLESPRYDSPLSANLEQGQYVRVLLGRQTASQPDDSHVRADEARCVGIARSVLTRQRRGPESGAKLERVSDTPDNRLRAQRTGTNRRRMQRRQEPACIAFLDACDQIANDAANLLALGCTQLGINSHTSPHKRHLALRCGSGRCWLLDRQGATVPEPCITFHLLCAWGAALAGYAHRPSWRWAGRQDAASAPPTSRRRSGTPWR